MFDGSWSEGWNIIVQSVKALFKYPVLLVPIILVWLVYAPVILWLKYTPSLRAMTFSQEVCVAFLVILLLSVITLMACATLLEMIQQIERGTPSLAAALSETLSRDAIKILPLALVWAIIWLLLTVLEAIFARKRDSDDDSTLNAQSAAETLAGYGNFSFTDAFFNALKKGVRMVVFLILPAIAWDDLDPFDAAGKGLAILRAHLSDFVAGYALTYAAAVVVFLPPAVILELGTGRHHNPPLVHFPDSVWVGVIIYIGLAWSFCMYLEQMSMAQLYLWHLKWEKAREEAKLTRRPIPEFREVSPPRLLEGMPDFLQA